MKLLLIPNIVVTMLLAVGAASAQTRFTQRDLPESSDSYQTGLKTYYKTWADLNDAQKRMTSFPGDWYRFDVARGEMDQLERTWQDGSYKTSQLVEAISDLQTVLNVNNVSEHDRRVLEEDLEQLRNIRVRYAD